jgi:hypothetical protein
MARLSEHRAPVAHPERPEPEPEPEPGTYLDPAQVAIRDAHEAAIRRGQPSYLDPVTGYVVLTAPALLARGDCCGNCCRHCPWPEGA